MEKILYLLISILGVILASLLGVLFKYINARNAEKGRQEEIIKHAPTLAQIQAAIQAEWAKEIEELKGLISRNNTSLQIYNVELAKIRFESLKIIFIKLIDLKRFIQSKAWGHSFEQRHEVKEDFFRLHQEVENELYSASLFIPSSSINLINQLLSKFFSTYQKIKIVADLDSKINQMEQQWLISRNDFPEEYYKNKEIVANKNLEIVNFIETEIPNLLIEIQKNFKEALKLNDDLSIIQRNDIGNDAG